MIKKLLLTLLFVMLCVNNAQALNSVESYNKIILQRKGAVLNPCTECNGTMKGKRNKKDNTIIWKCMNCGYKLKEDQYGNLIEIK